jgi:hypothetical protein
VNEIAKAQRELQRVQTLLQSDSSANPQTALEQVSPPIRLPKGFRFPTKRLDKLPRRKK